jgi:hypothetical protein
MDRWGPSMSDWMKNPTNQVRRVTDGRFCALWRGQVVYAPDGTVQHFETERDARAFLARCDAAGRITEQAPPIGRNA